MTSKNLQNNIYTFYFCSLLFISQLYLGDNSKIIYLGSQDIDNFLSQKQLGIYNECVSEKVLSQIGGLVNELEDKSIYLDSSAFDLIFGTKII